MDPNVLEAELQNAGALIVEPRLIRRVVMNHRRIGGLGLQVPHIHCYGIQRDTLQRYVEPDEIDVDLTTLPEEVVLLARLPPSRTLRKRPELLRERFRRYLFHSLVHLELERLVREEKLNNAQIRERIERIGHIEFDEVRAILRHDDLLLPPYDDQQQYIEFVALYLELRHFAPDLLAPTFPSLQAYEEIDAHIAMDLDVDALLQRVAFETEEISPNQADSAPAYESVRAIQGSMIPEQPPDSVPPPPSDPLARQMMRAGDRAKSVGNDVRSALLYAQAVRAFDIEMVNNRISDDLRSLTNRLDSALRVSEEADHADHKHFDTEWNDLLRLLVDTAALYQSRRYPVEAQLLFELQQAAVSHERPQSEVGLARWMLSFGKKSLVRPLPATREVRIARHFRNAVRKASHTRIAGPDRKLLEQTLNKLCEQADLNVREALRPAITAAFDKVGLTADNSVEQVARDKLVEELLDEIVERGFTSFSHLRDALSRNQLKLNDLSKGLRLFQGDELLRLDQLLARSLDGAYRSGEVYLRGLQRFTSLLFGTPIGRFIFLFLLLPFGGSYLLLEGLTYIVVYPLNHAFGLPPIAVLTQTTFFTTAFLALSLVHLSWLRVVAKKLIGWIGWLLLTLFVHIPRWILHRRVVWWFFEIRFVRAVLRRIVLPLASSSVVYYLVKSVDWPIEGPWAEIAGSITFLLIAPIMGPRMGELVEELMFDWVAPRWRVFSHQVVPGLLRLITDVFRRFMDFIERGMYRVDELLRFRTGQNRVVLAFEAVAGFVWGIAAYLIRMYITLFVEPELNPLKHFPVATVAHKLTLPILLPVPTLAVGYFETVFPPFITYFLGAFVSITVFIVPSVFGFLAWEIKENRKLYRATRPAQLEPLALGPHGKNMAELLLPGLHSGTLPKLYERLRRNAQQEDEMSRSRQSRSKGSRHRALGYRARFQDGIQEVETDVRRFVEREILTLLSRAAQWSYGPIHVDAINCGSNRIRIQLSCRQLDEAPCEIAFEEQEGFILASIPVQGFVQKLPKESEALQLFENAVLGLYHICDVDFVSEQISQQVGANSVFEIADKHLVVWPDQDFRTELSYKIRSAIPFSRIRPKVRGEVPAKKPNALLRKNIFFKRNPVTWQQWIEAWQDEIEQGVPKLSQGPAILPPVGVE